MRGFPSAVLKITAMVEPAEKSAFTAAPAISQTRTPWFSPVPYLFGGLAAMLGLIAFALLLLACSYWKLSGRSDGEKVAESGEKVAGKVYEEKILVIMAGEERPTFLATAVAAKTPGSGAGGGVVNKEGKEGQNRKSGVQVPTGTEGSSHEENQ